MTYLFFMLVLFLAGGIVAVLRVVGVRLRFESTFKALAILVTMLPILVMGALVVFVLEVGAVLVVLLALYFTGVVADLSAIPHRYQVLSICALIVVALCISGISWVRYVLLVHRENE